MLGSSVRLLGAKTEISVNLAIPMKVGSASDLNPVADSEVKLGVFGAQRRWRSHGA